MPKLIKRLIPNSRKSKSDPIVKHLASLYVSDWIYPELLVNACYGLDNPGIESRLGPDFPQPSRPVLGPTQPHKQWIPFPFPRREAAGALSIHPHLEQRLKKEKRYTSTSPLDIKLLWLNTERIFTECKRENNFVYWQHRNMNKSEWDSVLRL